MLVVDLTHQHRCLLGRFECAGSGTSWAREVEEMVHRLADELEHNTSLVALGLLDDDSDLAAVAVAAPQIDPEVWRIAVIATRNGLKRRGYGSRIKSELLNRARAGGIRVCASLVHFDNEAMLQLNAKLGAQIERDPLDHDYAICTVTLV